MKDPHKPEDLGRSLTFKMVVEPKVGLSIWVRSKDGWDVVFECRSFGEMQEQNLANVIVRMANRFLRSQSN